MHVLCRERGSTQRSRLRNSTSGGLTLRRTLSCSSNSATFAQGCKGSHTHVSRLRTRDNHAYNSEFRCCPTALGSCGQSTAISRDHDLVVQFRHAFSQSMTSGHSLKTSRILQVAEGRMCLCCQVYWPWCIVESLQRERNRRYHSRRSRKSGKGFSVATVGGIMTPLERLMSQSRCGLQ